MKVKELIERLKEYDGETEITILDGFNGGGKPRTINFGPVLMGPMDQENHFCQCEYSENVFAKCTCKGNDDLDYSDLQSSQYETIIIMGYGCY